MLSKVWSCWNEEVEKIYRGLDTPFISHFSGSIVLFFSYVLTGERGVIVFWLVLWGLFLVRASGWLDKEKHEELIQRVEGDQAKLHIAAYKKRVIFLEARVAELELRLTNSTA